jgi:hypothetical protein
LDNQLIAKRFYDLENESSIEVIQA